MQFNMGLQYIAADRDSIKFAWKNAAGTVLIDNDSDNTNIVVPSPGTYTLEITVYKFGSSCTLNFNHTIDLTGRFPSAPLADSWPLKICENDNTATYNVLTPDPDLIYLWTVPASATKVQDDSTGTLVVRWNGPTGGNTCVKARNLCGDGPETCLPVVYVDMIDPAFSLAVEVCKDGTTPITATSTHTATPVVYNWDFARLDPARKAKAIAIGGGHVAKGIRAALDCYPTDLWSLFREQAETRRVSQIETTLLEKVHCVVGPGQEVTTLYSRTTGR